MNPGRTLEIARTVVARYASGLAAQMLALSVAVVIAADMMLLLPSLGNFHDNWLRDRVEMAANAAATQTPDKPVSRLDGSILRSAGVHEVIVHRGDGRRVALPSDLPADARVRSVDLRKARVLRPMADGVSVLLRPRIDYLRIVAKPNPQVGRAVEAVVFEPDLRGGLFWHARRALLESLIASLFVGACLYAALMALVVRRMRRLTSAIEALGRRPQDATAMPKVRGDDEIGRAEQALARAGEDVRSALRQRERLAGLGAAVAKIAHDLRNSLATAQLVSERLSGSDDPKVRQSAPRLERAIARAASLAEAALKFGKADEPRPALHSVNVHAALEEAAGDALAGYPRIAWRNGADAAAIVHADSDNLHRILVNLLRNAAEALRNDPGGRIEGVSTRKADAIDIDIVDTGGGVDADLREALFQPFATAQRDSGVGLGLAIARELARAMGGDVTLVASDAGGSCFRVTLPVG